jgi:acyl carrier protein
MNEKAEEVAARTRTYLLDEYLPGESPDSLGNATPLITSGILDSIGTVKLASFLEGEFGIELEAHEMSVDLLNTIDDITRLVLSKRPVG